eukprot:GHUV01008873.1.p2 GENE.GHUV01008873.1~~GHUV01008873.1.p2  ORF type:complete len:121 (+),score=26.40 GHUV01008873.1:327-689(+)
MGFEFKVYTGKDEEFRKRLKDPNKTPHRCDDRVTDLCRCIVAWESLENLKQTWRVMWECVASEPGQEPKGPYVLVVPSDPCYKDHNKQIEQQQQQTQQMQREQQQQQQPKSWWRWRNHGS